MNVPKTENLKNCNFSKKILTISYFENMPKKLENQTKKIDNFLILKMCAKNWKFEKDIENFQIWKMSKKFPNFENVPRKFENLPQISK
jgi:hypothetical protein